MPWLQVEQSGRGGEPHGLLRRAAHGRRDYARHGSRAARAGTAHSGDPSLSSSTVAISKPSFLTMEREFADHLPLELL